MKATFMLRPRCQFAIFGSRILLSGSRLPKLSAFGNSRAEVDAGFLVGTNEFGQFDDQVFVETYQLLGFRLRL